MKKFQQIVVLSAIVILAVSGLLISKNKFSKPQTVQDKTQVVTESTLKINDKSFDINSFVGKTALEATEANAKIETKGTGEMAFVTKIDGKLAEPNKKEFWEMLVNGKQAEVGAGTYIIKSGDQIEWKLSNY